MTEVWSERADAYRESEAHRSGRDLELFAEWAAGRTVLDVATGGGHVARRLRDEGCTVVTVDPAPGMEPDVVAPAEALPFGDGAFDVVTCRIAAHHFADIRKAVAEMTRVSNRLLVIEDNVYRGEHVEEAERLRDPSHVRCYSEDDWKSMAEQAGFEVEQVEHFPRKQSFDAWLERVGTTPEAAAEIRSLLSDDIDDEGKVELHSIVLKARRSQK